MTIDRPAPGTLVFQCDACYDTIEFESNNQKDCWAQARDSEGWSKGGTGPDHYCADCTRIRKDEIRRRFQKHPLDG